MICRLLRVLYPKPGYLGEGLAHQGNNTTLASCQSLPHFPKFGKWGRLEGATLSPTPTPFRADFPLAPDTGNFQPELGAGWKPCLSTKKPYGLTHRVGFSRLPRTEAGIYPAGPCQSQSNAERHFASIQKTCLCLSFPITIDLDIFSFFIESMGAIIMSYLDIAKWVWEQFGEDVTKFAKVKWEKFNWKEAEIKYRERLAEIHSTTRLLGHPKPINVSEIFTDVYVLDSLTAHRRFGLVDLPENEQDFDNDIERKPALRLAIKQNKLFILGKPGAGKTTFLKYIVLKACEGQIKKTPIFISLKEWSDSEHSLEKGLDNYLQKQFEICSFPDAKLFIDELLKKGQALVLFDGLDEVKQDGNVRSRIIGLVKDFAKKYSNNQIFITCRIAAVEYSFEDFTYVEIADFDFKQTTTFVRKWYLGQEQKSRKFLNELNKPENKGFLDLARTPLLLTLLCLAYDELLEFPLRRVDLYKEAFDALLKKWDASRDVQRDEIYKGLSILRKENLLSRIAYQNFQKGKFLFREEELVRQINDYLEQLPSNDIQKALPDGESVLKAIEAQHGLIVERAYGVYSFSHLTFQEYLTARYIVQNSVSGTLDDLANKICLDQWSEVVSLTASLLDNADIFINNMYEHLNSYLNSRELINLFRWLKAKSADVPKANSTRTLLLLWVLYQEYLILDKNAKRLALSTENSQEFEEIKSFRRLVQEALGKTARILGFMNIGSGLLSFLSQSLLEIFSNSNDLQSSDYDSKIIEIQDRLKESLWQMIEISVLDLETRFKFTKKDYKDLIALLDGSFVILLSLELATVSNRNKMQEILLTSPKNIRE